MERGRVCPELRMKFLPEQFVRMEHASSLWIGKVELAVRTLAIMETDSPPDVVFRTLHQVGPGVIESG